MLDLVSRPSISVEWFNAKTHSKLSTNNINDDEELQHNVHHRDSVDLNLILRKGDKMANPISHRTAITTTYICLANPFNWTQEEIYVSIKM